MKLPKDRKERIQMLVLIALGVAGVVYAVVQLGVAPLVKDRKAALSAIEKVQKQLERANRDIKKANSLGEGRKKIKAELRKIDEKYIVKADYDAYRLAVTPRIERAAKTAGVALRQHSPVSGGGQFGVVKGKKDRGKRVVKGFKVQVAGTGGYEDLVEMLSILETENPFIIVSDVTITGSADVRRHSLMFTVMWPIWLDESIPKGFAAEEDEKT